MSLKYRIAVTIFILEAALLTFVFSQVIRTLDRSLTDSSTETELLLVDLLSDAGRSALLTDEYALLQPRLDRMIGDSGVLRAVIADDTGTVIASLNVEDVGGPLPDISASGQDRRWRQTTLTNATGLLGTVAIQFSNEPLQAALAEARLEAVIGSIIGVSVIAIVGILSGIFLTRKLARLTVAADQLASGDLTARALVKGSDEVSKLGNVFDTMADSIQKERVRLIDSNEALRESEQGLRQSLTEKDTLVREIHHRVKNNLQVISSLLYFHAKELDAPATIEVFQRARDRLSAMILIQEKLYESRNLSRIEFSKYLSSLVRALEESSVTPNSSVRLRIDADPVELPIEQAHPAGLVLCELVTNAFKHAFPNGRSGEVTVSFKVDGTRATLSTKDNGIGLNDDLDLDTTRSFGWQLVKNLAAQLEGQIKIESGDGTHIQLSFDLKDSQSLSQLEPEPTKN